MSHETTGWGERSAWEDKGTGVVSIIAVGSLR